MTRTIFWIVVAVIMVSFMVYREVTRKRTKQTSVYHREKTAHEKQIEVDIATEKGKNHGPMGPMGGR